MGYLQNSVNGLVFGYDASKFNSSNLAVLRNAIYPKGIVSISQGWLAEPTLGSSDHIE